MKKDSINIKGYISATLLGAVGGGILVASATKAIPKMMSEMMWKMMVRMKDNGCNPEEM